MMSVRCSKILKVTTKENESETKRLQNDYKQCVEAIKVETTAKKYSKKYSKTLASVINEIIENFVINDQLWNFETNLTNM